MLGVLSGERLVTPLPSLRHIAVTLPLLKRLREPLPMNAGILTALILSSVYVVTAAVSSRV